jgi:hypothetical protein
MVASLHSMGLQDCGELFRVMNHLCVTEPALAIDYRNVRCPIIAMQQEEIG